MDGCQVRRSPATPLSVALGKHGASQGANSLPACVADLASTQPCWFTLTATVAISQRGRAVPCPSERDHGLQAGAPPSSARFSGRGSGRPAERLSARPSALPRCGGHSAERRMERLEGSQGHRGRTGWSCLQSCSKSVWRVCPTALPLAWGELPLGGARSSPTSAALLEL